MSNETIMKVDDLKEKKKYIDQVAKDKLSVRRLADLLIKDGYVKPRGLAAVGSEKERKLLRSGFRQYLNPFEAILEMDLAGLVVMPKANVKSTYEAAKKARGKLDANIKDLEKSLK